MRRGLPVSAPFAGHKGRADVATRHPLTSAPWQQAIGRTSADPPRIRDECPEPAGSIAASRTLFGTGREMFQQMENDMRMLKTAAISLAALSVVAAPVAASAASAAGGASAVSVTDGENGLEGNSSWLIGLLGLLVGVGAIILIADDDDDAPVSP